jgi:hypothetical protein
MAWAFDEAGRYKPPGAVKVRDKESGAWAFIYTDAQGHPAARVFTASKQRLKPVWGHWFMSPAYRDQRVAEFFAGQRARLARKAKAKAERSAPHTLTVGAVLYSSWGYEQTNVSFYQVVALKGASSVMLRKISGEMVDSEGYSSMAGKTRAVRDTFKGEAFAKRVSMYGGRPSVKIDRSETAWLDDGSAHYVSWYG